MVNFSSSSEKLLNPLLTISDNNPKYQYHSEDKLLPRPGSLSSASVNQVMQYFARHWL